MCGSHLFASNWGDRCVLRSAIYCIVVFFFVAARPHDPSRISVCIVGGGIGGGAVSYFLRNRSDISVEVFESRSEVGGRLKHIDVDGFIVEVGGDAWSSANEYVVQIVKDLGLNSSVIKKVGDPISSTVGVWNGETLLHSEGILLEHALSDLSILLDEGNFLLDLKENYRARDGEKDGGSFTSIEAFLKPGRLDRYTSISSDAYFTRQKVSNETLRDLLEPLQRCIYGQGLSAHAFSTLVSLTSMVGAGSVSTGNSQLVKAMFSASNANVNLETRVTRVTRRPSTTENADDELEFVLETNTSETHRCRSVVVAAPIEFTGIEWRGGIDIDPSTFRKFEDCYVTIVRAQHVNATFFGLAKASANVPFNIFTTQDAFDTMHVPFTVLQFEERLDNGYNLYKFFSVERIATSTIDDIFVSPTVVFEQHWNYTFPVLKVTDDANGGDFQSIVLSPGVFYLNTMESVASAMEGSVIAGRNVAELASKVLL